MQLLEVGMITTRIFHVIRNIDSIANSARSTKVPGGFALSIVVQYDDRRAGVHYRPDTTIEPAPHGLRVVLIPLQKCRERIDDDERLQLASSYPRQNNGAAWLWRLLWEPAAPIPQHWAGDYPKTSKAIPY